MNRGCSCQSQEPILLAICMRQLSSRGAAPDSIHAWRVQVEFENAVVTVRLFLLLHRLLILVLRTRHPGVA